MSIEKVLQWQWSGYSAAHQNRINLLLHLIAVPLFMSATLLAVYALVRFSLPALAAPRFVILRLFAEKWITFPRFVLTGGWFENLSNGAPKLVSSKAKVGK